MARTIAAPTSVSGATPAGAPMHHAARSASANQPRLSSGDSQSVPKSRTPTACSSSDDAGKKAVSDVLSTKCSCEVQPVCTNRSDGRHVVPEGVGREHPVVQRVEDPGAPGARDGRHRDHRRVGDPRTEGDRVRRRDCGLRLLDAVGAGCRRSGSLDHGGDTDARDQHRYDERRDPEQTDRAEHLADDDDRREDHDRLREDGYRAAQLRTEAGAEDARRPNRRSDCHDCEQQPQRIATQRHKQPPAA